MVKYRKKPVVIEAIRWTGDNIADVTVFMGPDEPGYVGKRFSNADDLVVIETLEGRMIANKGDLIIRGVKGELYPCKPDIFEATYEAVNDGNESGP